MKLYATTFVEPGDLVAGRHQAPTGQVTPVLVIGDLSLILEGTDAETASQLRRIAAEAGALADAAEIRAYDARAAQERPGEAGEPDGPPDSYWEPRDDSAYRAELRDAGRGHLVR